MSDAIQLSRRLDAELRRINERDYGPGGRIYNRIAAQDGTAQADIAFALVKQHLAEQEAQTERYANER